MRLLERQRAQDELIKEITDTKETKEAEEINVKSKEDIKSNKDINPIEEIQPQLKPNDSQINSTPIVYSYKEQRERNLSKIKSLEQEITDN